MTAERTWQLLVGAALVADVVLHRRGEDLLSTCARRHKVLVAAAAVHLLLPPLRGRMRS